MICPLMVKSVGKDRDSNDILYGEECCQSNCSWWDSKANFNPETKQYKGQCCIFTLSRLKISGGINTHPY